MGAHKNTPHLNAGWKQKIQTSLLVNRLNANSLGKLDIPMTPGQIESAKILLRKVTPDLSNVSVGQDPEAGPITIRWESK